MVRPPAPTTQDFTRDLKMGSPGPEDEARPGLLEDPNLGGVFRGMAAAARSAMPAVR